MNNLLRFRKHSLSGLQLQSGMQCVQRSNCRAANLAVFRRRKDFALQKSREDSDGMGSPTRSRQHTARAKKFQRKFALRRVGSARFVVPPTRERSKVRNIARLGKISVPGSPGARGTAVPLFREESRGTLPRGSFGNFFAEARHRASFADKKRGVENHQLAGHCQSTPGPRTTEYQSPGASLRGFCVIPQSHSLQDFSAYQYRSLFAARYNTQTAADSPRPATAGTSAPYRAQS